MRRGEGPHGGTPFHTHSVSLILMPEEQINRREAEKHGLYDADFVLWSQRNAELLRAGATAEADLAHIAEEIEDMGKARAHALESRIERILEHLLKLHLASGGLREGNERAWRTSIVRQQLAIKHLLKESPSLRASVPGMYAEAYPEAVRIVGVGFGFECPAECPFTLEEVLG